MVLAAKRVRKGRVKRKRKNAAGTYRPAIASRAASSSTTTADVVVDWEQDRNGFFPCVFFSGGINKQLSEAKR
jgi:hypothetical protein